MHRTYEGTNTQVRIYWFSDRVEIYSPGGLYGQVNPENLGKGATDYRNPLVAEAMNVLGYVQRCGLGVPAVKQEFQKNGNQPPEFDFRPESVLVTLGLDVRRTALDVRVLASDLDPQANLTHRFLKEDRLGKRWAGKHRNTLFGRVNLIPRGTGDITKPPVEPIGNIGLLVGDLRVSGFEDRLSDNQPRCLDGEEAAFRVISAFYRGIELAAQEQEAGKVLIDFGPNLGAINRVAILSAQYVVVPLVPDLFSLQGLRNLGPI